MAKVIVEGPTNKINTMKKVCRSFGLSFTDVDNESGYSESDSKGTDKLKKKVTKNKGF